MILVDTSVWIDCFHGGSCKVVMNELIDQNEVCVNDVILAELLPSIQHRGVSGAPPRYALLHPAFRADCVARFTKRGALPYNGAV